MNTTNQLRAEYKNIRNQVVANTGMAKESFDKEVLQIMIEKRFPKTALGYVAGAIELYEEAKDLYVEPCEDELASIAFANERDLYEAAMESKFSDQWENR